MGALALVSLMGVMLFAATLDGGTDEDRVSDDTMDDVPDPVVGPDPDGITRTLTDGGAVTGTAGADTFTLDVDGSAAAALDLDTGDGDDTITGNVQGGAASVTITGGDGDDVINLQGPESGTIDGGTGNDTITVFDAGSTTDVLGGVGDDVLVVTTGGDPATVRGGEGNDTLSTGADPDADGFFSQNIVLMGEAGDDVITLVGPGSSGAGFVEQGHGGDGNDTITMISRLPDDETLFNDARSIVASGGTGADTFVIDFEDYLVPPQVFTDNGLPVPDTFELAAFEIEDFEPGIDMLMIDADAATANGTMSEARLVEDTDVRGDPRTTLTLVYTNPDQPPVEATVVMVASGVTWNDVAFVGAQMPMLTGPDIGQQFSDGVDNQIIGTAGSDTISGVTNFGPRGDGNNDFIHVIDAAAGDDVIDLDNPTHVSLDAGTGDDTITVDGIGETVAITGGPGDDQIVATGADGQASILGGTGNDILSSGPLQNADGDYQTNNIAFFGEDGDDRISIQGPSDGFAGVTEYASGGMGNDTLSMTVRLAGRFGDSGFNQGPIRVQGDEGSDTFSINFEDARLDPALSDPAAFGFQGNAASGTLSDQMFRIADFESVTETIFVDADSVVQGGALTEARLEPSTSGNGATLVLRYEYADQPALEAEIRIESDDPVTWNDIVFAGNQAPTLQPTA